MNALILLLLIFGAFLAAILRLKVTHATIAPGEVHDPEEYAPETRPHIEHVCHHPNQTDVSVGACVTCETVWTYCDDCGEVINKRVDCI